MDDLLTSLMHHWWLALGAIGAIGGMFGTLGFMRDRLRGATGLRSQRGGERRDR